MKIAIVGSGVSGLVAAHLLSPRHDVVLFEADDRIGGHVHTVDVGSADGRTAVDTGFIVFNRKTYPSFVRLLERLGVEAQESEMSFGVRSEARDLEYSGSSLLGLYAQPANAVSPRFHRMVADIFRFFREARELLEKGPEVKLLSWLEARGYSRAFIEDHLLPMVGAVWSSSREGVKEFPARFLARFFDNHGFLQVNDRPTWYTVKGGSRTYVEAILAGFRGEVRTSCPVLSVRREPRAVIVCSAGGSAERFDHAILACHADQALRMLEDPSPVEQELLSAFPYRANDVLLHDDEGVMPRRRRAWASWNYHLDDGDAPGASVTYWMNRLQRLPGARQWFVTLNRRGAVRPERVVSRFEYHHPVFTAAGVTAQARHPELLGHRRTSYCGAYWRNGFHEDGVVSALAACRGFEVSL
ncbi:MAG TPA: FAD-dependent oxidoreductase [Anaeromyxobacter sp.]|nr:FAD-dependent oxidoreductase [Anaeromyxobacter sp.]